MIGTAIARRLRSILWFAAAVVVSLLYCCFLPVLLLPRAYVRAVYFSYLRVGLWLLRVICGITFNITGHHNIPHGPVLFASKHQSAWDSAMLPMLLGDTATIVRRDLIFIPLTGLIVARMGHLRVSRRGDIRGFGKLLEQAKKVLRRRRSLLVFPEGTRRSARPYGAPSYERGVVALYRALGVPCVPVALNSGLVWPRRTFLKSPGKIRVDILPAISPGLASADFFATLTDVIETRSRRLAE